MNTRLLPLAVACLLLIQFNSYGQSQDVPRFEIAGEFSVFGRESFFRQQTEPGAGARFTFNLNRSLAFEAAGYLFPRHCNICRNAGNVSQVVAGVKAGKRFEKWGIFAKARPGIASFSRGEFNPILTTPTGPIEIETNRITSFAIDLGGVLEFYPSRRIVTRFDLGDTIIHFKRRTVNAVMFDPVTKQFSLFPFVRPPRTTHSSQFSASVGFRF